MSIRDGFRRAFGYTALNSKPVRVTNAAGLEFDAVGGDAGNV